MRHKSQQDSLIIICLVIAIAAMATIAWGIYISLKVLLFW